MTLLAVSEQKSALAAHVILTTPVREHIEIHAMKRLDLFLYGVIYLLRHEEFSGKYLAAWPRVVEKFGSCLHGHF